MGLLRGRNTALDSRIPGYRLNYKIGEGGMGTVYHATQLNLDRPVAVKVLTHRLARDAGMIERFEREAGALAKLSHPNVVSVIERGNASGIYYFAMEFIDGPSLSEIIATRALLPEEFRKFIDQVGSALSYMHANSIVHRDIKPSNILLDPRGDYRVSDFGLITVLSTAHGGTGGSGGGGSLVGTPMYLAPEQLHAHGNISPATDVFGFAVVLYELLTGVLPLGRYKSPTELNHTVSPVLSQCVLMSLSRDNKERFQSIEEMLGALHAGLHASPDLRLRVSKVAAEKVSLHRSAGASPSSSRNLTSSVMLGRRKRRTKGRIIAYSAVAAVLLVAAALFLMLRPKEQQIEGGDSAVAAKTVDLRAELSWASTWDTAERQAKRNSRPVLLFVTGDGKLDALDLRIAEQSAEAFKELTVPIVLPLREAKLRFPSLQLNTLPVVATFSASGPTLLRQSSYPPLSGLFSFAEKANAEARVYDRWQTDCRAAFADAASAHRPVLLIATVGRVNDGDIEYAKLNLSEAKVLSDLLDRFVLLWAEDLVDEAYLTKELGFFAYPLVAVVKVTAVDASGGLDAEVSEGVLTYPIANYQELADMLLENL